MLEELEKCIGINEKSAQAMGSSNSANKGKEKAIEDEKIVDNIKVMADTIGSIAGQTNLLALNAAIEAVEFFILCTESVD
jgi:methyl-accepting chemotaxis protein